MYLSCKALALFPFTKWSTHILMRMSTFRQDDLTSNSPLLTHTKTHIFDMFVVLQPIRPKHRTNYKASGLNKFNAFLFTLYCRRFIYWVSAYSFRLRDGTLFDLQESKQSIFKRPFWNFAGNNLKEKMILSIFIFMPDLNPKLIIFSY